MLFVKDLLQVNCLILINDAKVSTCEACGLPASNTIQALATLQDISAQCPEESNEVKFDHGAQVPTSF